MISGVSIDGVCASERRSGTHLTRPGSAGLDGTWAEEKSTSFFASKRSICCERRIRDCGAWDDRIGDPAQDSLYPIMPPNLRVRRDSVATSVAK
jgi:hypothetical protein